MEKKKQVHEYYFAKEVTQNFAFAEPESEIKMIAITNDISDQYCLYEKIGNHEFKDLISEEILSDEITEQIIPMNKFYDYAQDAPYAITELEKVYEGPYYTGLHTNLLAQLRTKNQTELERQKSIQRRARIKNIFQRRK